MPGKRRRPRNYRAPVTLLMSGLTGIVTTAAVLTHPPKLTTPHATAAFAPTLPVPSPTPTATEPTPVLSYPARFVSHRKQARPRVSLSQASRDTARATPSPVPTARPRFTSTTLSTRRWQVIAAAKTQLGDPYVWGGVGPSGWDCSGLVQWAFAQAGLGMPRVAADQARMGVATSVANLDPGDLVAWSGHIALWLGGGQILEAQRPGTVVHIRTFGTQGWWDDSAWGVKLDYSDLPRL